MSQVKMTYLPIFDLLFAIPGKRKKEKLSREFIEIIKSIFVIETLLSIVLLTYLLNIFKEDINNRLDLLYCVLSIYVEEDLLVKLLHLSFRNFLFDIQKDIKSIEVDKKETYNRLARKCLQ